MAKYKLIFISFLLINFVQAQALIKGVVRDANTKENLEFVSVILNDSYKGTSTNAKGEFTLEIPDYSSSRSFSFQRVGYYSKTISMIDFMRSDTIYLEIDEQFLSEVVVRPKDAFELLQEVVKRIPDNYYSQPVAQDVFYRQSVFLNEQLRGLEESRYHLINTFQRPKLPRSVTVQKARGFSNLKELKDLGKLVASNLDEDSLYVLESAEGLFAFNPNLEQLIKDKTGVFNPNAQKYYDFDYVGMVIRGGNVMHHIIFDQREGLKKTLYQGSMYIDTVSLAIVEFEAKLSPSGIDYQKLIPLKFRMLAKLAGYTVQVYNLAFSVKYEQYENYWVVAGGNFNLGGSIAKRKEQTVNGVLKVDYTVLRNFPKTEFYSRSSNYDVIPSSLDDFKDKYYWGDQNIPYLPQDIEIRLNKLLRD